MYIYPLISETTTPNPIPHLENVFAPRDDPPHRSASKPHVRAVQEDALRHVGHIDGVLRGTLQRLRSGDHGEEHQLQRLDLGKNDWMVMGK